MRRKDDVGMMTGLIDTEARRCYYPCRLELEMAMPQWLTIALRLTGLGWYIAICIVLGVLGGLWLGNLTGQRALPVLLGAVLGSVIAFYGVYRMALPAIYGSRVRSSGGRGSGERPKSSASADEAGPDTTRAADNRDA